jgi:uncharacterized repeat protein (TIGR03803 family)
MMPRSVRPLRCLSLLALLGCLLARTQAQTYELIKAVESSGAFPGSSLVKTESGDFLGTAPVAGSSAFGTIYKITAAGQFSVLKNLIFPGGIYPAGPLVKGTDGKFYGVTNSGGTAGRGTVYRFTEPGTLEKLAQFPVGRGVFPQGRLAQGTDGSVFGVATAVAIDGSPLPGIVFKLTPAKVLSDVASFQGEVGKIANLAANDPYVASGLIKGPDGNFYGVSSVGGSQNAGTAFRVTPTGTLTLLATFGGANPGRPVGALLAGQDGNLYGTTTEGGTNSKGTVYQLTTAGALTVVASFDGTNGTAPFSELIQDGSGVFYGTTRSGGMNNAGTVFKMTLAGVVGTITKIADLDTTNGSSPVAGLAFGNSQSLLGVAQVGGANGSGTAFSVSSGGAVTKLTDFGSPSGLNFNAGLTAGPDGAMYGSTLSGGALASGTFCKVTTPASPTLPDLSNVLDYTTGRPSATQFILADDQKFYGAFYTSQANPKGGILRFDTTGVPTVLATFTGPDGNSPNGVTQASDGAFYGTTALGGANNMGVVFRYTSANGIEKLFDFDANSGANPGSLLVEGPDGALYGTAAIGGPLNHGTVFRITTDGEFKKLVNFKGTTGAIPAGGLVVGVDGFLYGATSSGGPTNLGVIYKVTTSGTFTVLAMPNALGGAFINGQLVNGPHGDLYGLANAGGGAGKYGTVFKVTRKGTISVLKTFAGGSDGAYPTSSLAVGPDGNLYGTTINTVFRLKTNNHTPVVVDDNLTLPVIHANVRKNDSDADKDPFKITSVTAGAHGAVEINSDGTLTYVPDLSFTATDTFTYTVTDVLGAKATATVHVALPANLSAAGIGGYTGILSLGGVNRGYAGLAVAPLGLFTAGVFLDGNKTVVKGVFDPITGVFQKTITRPGGLPDLTVNFTLDPGRNRVFGTVTAGAEVFPVELSRTFPSFSTSLPTARAGRYTVLFPTDATDISDPNVPQGTGYAAITISKTGAVSLIGRLGDSTSFMAASKITHNDQFPVYISLYSNKGFLAGLVIADTLAGSDLTGVFTWKKPATGTLYPTGFTTNPTLIGSRYAATTPVLTLAAGASNAKLVYQTLGLTKTLTVSKANGVTVTNPAADKTSMRIIGTSGIFSGKYVDGAITRSFAGAVIQKNAAPRGEGYYVGSASTDRIIFSAP